ncbi:MAG: lipoprotein signal peptidase [Bacteroidia bacterium]|nr:lipoprotein signal peptidase [Bacteroidia bacterium]
MNKRLLALALCIIFGVLIADQSLKIWIKTHLIIGEQIPMLGNWALLHFTENNGMAYGIELGGVVGKYFLSVFRIVAIIGFIWWLRQLIIKNAHWTAVATVSLIMVGALGNVIDCAFYGLWFNESFSQVATFMPKEGGYAGFLQGQVVDMLYFPIIQAHYPSWSPMYAGQELTFFSFIFNIADASISVGGAFLILNQKHLFAESGETIVAPVEATSIQN